MTTDPFAMDGPINEQGQEQTDDDTANQPRASVEGADAAERERASRYLDALGAEERTRREQINYADQYQFMPYSWSGRKDPCAVGTCGVCANRSLIGFHHGEEEDDDAIVGHCIVCSYERTSEVAGEAVGDIEFQRALDRD